MKRSKILLVEDEKIVAMDIQTMLHGIGYTVPAVASTGEEAVKKARELKPDLVLMDIVLAGGMDGIEAADQIFFLLGIPVVYLTAHTDEETLGRAKVTEPYGYIVKPFDKGELQTTIELALYKHGMEKKIRESKQWLSTTLKCIADAVIATDTNGHIILMNPVAESLLGLQELESQGRLLNEVFKMVDEDSKKPLPDPVTETVSKKNIVVFSDAMLLTAASGNEIFIEGSAAPIRDEQELLRGVVIVFRDISEKRKTERHLILMQKALDNMQLGVTIGSNKWKIMYTNAAEATMHGYTVGELTDQDVRIFAPNDFWQNRPGKLHELKSIKRESINVKKDGTLFPVALRSDVVTDSKGNIIGLVTTCEDITERKLMQEKLLRRNEALQSVYMMATVPGRSFEEICDQATLSISKMLQSSHAIIGFFEGEKKMQIKSIISDGVYNRQITSSIQCGICRKMREQDAVFQYQGRMKDMAPDSPLFMMYDVRCFLAVPIRNNKGDMMGIVAVMSWNNRVFTEDETKLVEIFARYIAFEFERNSLESQLREALKMQVIGQIASGVAHEVRNPLNAITAIAESICVDLEDNSEYKTSVEHIRSQADRLSRLMRDLLELGKPIQENNMHREALVSVISSAVNIWKQSEYKGRYKVKINQSKSVDDYCITCDNSKIQQIFVNLLENAAQHSPEGSEIRIAVLNSDNGKIIIRVIDQGTGVSHENLPRVFEPFFTTRQKGTGLGLSIVRHIVEMHQGSVVLWNNIPPPGCTVEITFPKAS